MRAVSLHRDVLLVTSAIFQANCLIVRGNVVGAEVDAGAEAPGAITVIPPAEPGAAAMAETFVIDSPVLPEELEALPALVEQARFPAPSGLLTTHGDWDHLLGRLAFPGLALGCAESTARRLAAEPGVTQRELRDFDEGLAIPRPSPLALGSMQALPVPGHCELGDQELELHPTGGHTPDGMAILIGWAGVLAVGDYLSPAEIPDLMKGCSIDEYEATLTVLEGLIERAERIVPGHGSVLDRSRAAEILDEDLAYLRALRAGETSPALPAGRGGHRDRTLHQENLAALS
jgi:glyoxylase-like metal-dependent hydrolase (beta-lactamase superfamily II)